MNLNKFSLTICNLHTNKRNWKLKISYSIYNVPKIISRDVGHYSTAQRHFVGMWRREPLKEIEREKRNVDIFREINRRRSTKWQSVLPTLSTELPANRDKYTVCLHGLESRCERRFANVIRYLFLIWKHWFMKSMFTKQQSLKLSNQAIFMKRV